MPSVHLPAAQSHYITANGIRLHYLLFEGEGPTLLLMHGLTANAHAFDGLMAAGLGRAARVVSVDLRGRGASEAPPADYSMAAHAADIIGLMDHLGLEQALIGGHSFGGLLSLYLAAHYPGRVAGLILLDAAARMHENTREMLLPALSRLGRTFPSFDDYLEKVKAAPYNDFWDAAMTSYYKADVQVAEDGAVTPIPQPGHMVQAVTGVLTEPWPDYIGGVPQPAILINGKDIYTLGDALLPEANARETVALMQHCRYVSVPGNHQTMLYGSGADATVKAIAGFLASAEAMNSRG